MKPSLKGPPGLSFPPDSRPGFTLLELVTVVALLGLVLGGLLPAARTLMDRMAVVGARESVVGVFHRARMEAVSRGGARVVLRASMPGVELWSGGALRSVQELGADFAVELTLSRYRGEVEIIFDPLGLGRIASQTLVFSRGRAEARLVVSSYGRVRRE